MAEGNREQILEFVESLFSRCHIFGDALSEANSDESCSFEKNLFFNDFGAIHKTRNVRFITTFET